MQSQSEIPKLYRTAEELETPEVSKISGNVPNWLCGSYIRCGPGRFDFDNFTMNHTLDGYCILSKFDVTEGTVSFTKKYLQSESYNRALAAQKPCVTEFGTRAFSDPNRSIFSRIINNIVPELTDNTQTGLYTIGNDLYVAGDTGFFHELDCCNLNIKSRNESSKLFGVNMLCSHALTDEDGFTYNIGISLISGLKYNIVKIPPTQQGIQSHKERMKKAKIISSIPTRNLTMFSFLHSFAMTKNYILYIEQPVVGSLTKVLGSVWTKGQCFRDWVEFRPEMKNRFVVVEKESGKVVKIEFLSKDAFVCFHMVNAYESDEQVIVDLYAFPNMQIFDVQTLENYRQGLIFNEDLSRVERYVLPVKTDMKNCRENYNLVSQSIKTSATAHYQRKENRIILSPEIIADFGDELPTFNRKFQGKYYQFIYSTGGYIPNSKQNSVYKIDVETKEILEWRSSEFSGCGEPMFVRNPEGTEEDDGVVLVAVVDSRDGCDKDYLVILDAKNLQELARAEFDAAIPAAAHGIFVPS